MGKLIDLSGHRFERLLVIKKAVLKKPGQAKWVCQCDCGNVLDIRSQDLRDGSSRSCGCLKVELQTKHGLSYSDEYHIWVDMRARCTNQRYKTYKHYGGRGIKVCERWSDFASFIEDMGPRTSEKHSIDRIDVNGNYEPVNCRWATNLVQARNKRTSNDTSGRVGVHFNTKRNRWRVNIGTIYVGTFKNKEDAIVAREKAEQKYWRKSS